MPGATRCQSACLVAACAAGGRCARAALLAVVMLAPVFWPMAAKAQTPKAEDQYGRVDEAITKAAAYLWAQWQDGHWPEGAPGANPRDLGGRTALCAYALLAAGENYQAERMAATLDWLSRTELKSVYARSFRAMAMSLVPLAKSGHTLRDDVQWLIAAARPDGAYDYTPFQGGTDAWDNSNSQTALLAVWSAAERGIDVPAEYWRREERHWLACQTGEGGWSYTTAQRPAYGSMSAAGLASLFICHDAVHHDEYVRVQADTSYPPIERGLAWLGKNFSSQENPGKGPQYFHYYLFAIERVALASGYKYLGRRDWFGEGAAELLRTQGPDGGWGNLEDTSLALLFLARGRLPIVFSKLRYEGAWNARPRDLAHLTRWVENNFETPVRWQVLDVSVPESEWLEAPVLYISGAAVPKFSPADIAKLRAYALSGGLILSEAAGNSPAFNLAMQDLYAKIFPEWPLAPVAADHTVFSSQIGLDRPMKLMGVSNGIRLLAVHSQADLSKTWQANETAGREDAFRLAANVYFYATDAELLRRHGPAISAAAGPVLDPRRTIEVALLTGAGLTNPEPMAYERLADRMQRECAAKLAFSAPDRKSVV
jgi:hypothetical protein